MNIASLAKDGEINVQSEDLSSAMDGPLADLSPSLRQLNQTYIDHVARRSLIPAADASSWCNSEVSVFLRHDRICVFAIVRGDAVAMADFVSLADAKLHVDAIGQSQSNAELGPLPNRRTIHAYLTGRLIEISDEGEFPDPKMWVPVGYHPLHNSTFVASDCGRPILTSSVIRMVPGTVKVWAPKQQESN